MLFNYETVTRKETRFPPSKSRSLSPFERIHGGSLYGFSCQNKNKETVLKVFGFIVGLVGSTLMFNCPVLAMETELEEDNLMSQVTNVHQLRNKSQVTNINRVRDKSQVTNVNQLRDIAPNDWAYEALRSLVDRYGCIVGFPNQTYRGNQSLSRYEFAAGLNSCLNQIERLIASSNTMIQEDIDKINRLLQEFEVELAALRGRVDNLESRTAFLEDHQFSTTAKLSGDVIFALGNAFGNNRAVPSGEQPSDEKIDRETFFSDRVRIKFDSSFSGQDRLHILLQANNTPNLGIARTGSDMNRLGFDGESDNNVFLDELWYESKVGDKFWFLVGTSDVDFDDGIFYPGPSYLEPSATGAISRFHRRNPLVNRGVSGAGGAVKYTFNDLLSLSSTYLTSDSNSGSPSPGEGLFNGSFSTGAQLDITPNDKLTIALTYLYDYYTDDQVALGASTGSSIADKPFGDVATAIHKAGALVNWEINDLLNLTAWGGWGNATALSSDRRNDNAVLWTWNTTLAFVDVVKEGAVAFVGVGSPPYAPSVDGGQADLNTPISILAQYNFPFTDNIQLSPGAYVTINPDGNNDNDTTTVGLIRTTFKF